MTDADWEGEGPQEGSNTVLTVFHNGQGIAESDRRGQPVVDDSFLIIFNAHHEDVAITLPGQGDPHRWTTVLDTIDGMVIVGTVSRPSMVDALPGENPERVGGDVLTVTARSMLLLQRTDTDG